MTANTRIHAAEKAIATGHLRAVASGSDSDHEAAVELEARGLLVEQPEVAPSVAWAAGMDRDDREGFFQDVRRAAATYDLAALEQALSTYWLIAVAGRVQDEAPGPPEKRGPLSVFAAVSATSEAERLVRLRGLVVSRGGSWPVERAQCVLLPEAVSREEATALLDQLADEGVVVVAGAAGEPRWIRPLPDIDGSAGDLFDPCDPAGGAE